MMQRVTTLLGADEEWERPLPEHWLRADIRVAVATFVLAVAVLQALTFSVATIAYPLWQQWLFLAIPSAALVLRRRYPLVAALAGVALIFLGAFWIAELTALLSTQAIAFFLTFSAAAWARNRWHVAGLAVAISLALLLWIAWLVAQASGASRIAEFAGLPDGETLSMAQVAAYGFYNLAINVVYFAAALVLGTVAWWDARRFSQVRDYSDLLERHAAAQTRQAVTAERLRIARELHDVVAHHVSAIGVQAGAARRVLERSGGGTGAGGDAAGGAGAGAVSGDLWGAPTADERVASTLAQVEESSRQAVTEMRSLLGALRDTGEVDPGEALEGALAAPNVPGEPAATDRSPAAGPGLDHLETLVAEVSATRPIVSFDVVEDAGVARADVPRAASASLYRIAQEALSNVRTHSTASSARLTLRTGVAIVRGAEEGPFAEVEVVDDGRPRHNTAGSGMGQLGMRERARSLGGAVEIGPRALGGYRVRVRLPLTVKEN